MIGLSQTDPGTYNAGVITIDVIGVGVTNTVIFDGLTIPPDSVLMYGRGQHTGADNASELVDANSSVNTPPSGFPTGGEWDAGFTLRNTSKATATVIETAAITGTTATTIAGTLSNSADWDTGDYYEVVVAGIVAGDLIEYETESNLSGVVSMSVKGVPVITGISGVHTFQIRLHDDTDNSDSPWYLITMAVV